MWVRVLKIQLNLKVILVFFRK